MKRIALTVLAIVGIITLSLPPGTAMAATVTIAAQSGSGSDTTTTADYEDVVNTSSAVTVTDVNSVLVVASFEMLPDSTQKRVATFRIRDDDSPTNNVSPVINRTLQRNVSNDKGIGSLVYIFDTSSDTGDLPP